MKLLLLSVVCVITSLGLFQLILIDALVSLSSIVPMENLGSDFHLGIIRNKFRWNLDSVLNLDASGSNCLSYWLRHVQRLEVSSIEKRNPKKNKNPMHAKTYIVLFSRKGNITKQKKKEDGYQRNTTKQTETLNDRSKKFRFFLRLRVQQLRTFMSLIEIKL